MRPSILRSHPKDHPFPICRLVRQAMGNEDLAAEQVGMVDRRALYHRHVRGVIKKFVH